MNKIRLGLRLESLGLPLRQALQQAERLGIAGVQVDAAGDLSPNSLSQTGRREFLHLLRSHNLQLTALGCPLRRGLDTVQDQQPRIEHVRKVMSLCFDLGPRLVIVQAGQVPEQDADPRLPILSESLQALGQHGDRTGTQLALETGLESGATLAQFLRRFDTGGLAVNLDPANLLLHGFDVFASVRDLRGRIVHAQAKDARAASASRAAQEVPVGRGDIDWLEYLSVLEEIEYRGWLVVEQETGENRLSDVSASIQFLSRFVA
jgi:sugar phosphate isomerase/epimerase